MSAAEMVTAQPEEEFIALLELTQKLSSRVLAEERLWYSPAYSLALHAQDLILHAHVLYDQDRYGFSKMEAPTVGVFHHPDQIRMNAEGFLANSIDSGGFDNVWHINQGSNWSIIFNRLANSNLALLHYIEELHMQLGIEFKYDRGKDGDIVLTDEEEDWVTHAPAADCRKFARERGIESAKIISLRNSLRKERELIGKIAWGKDVQE